MISSVIPELKKSLDLDRPFSLCGRRCYLIGFQNGSFPDYGFHISGEMSGIWTHPIKIADGFWISIETEDETRFGAYTSNMRNWLTDCNEFILGDGGAWVEHRYDLPKMQVSRREFIPYKEPAVGIDISVTSKNKDVKEAILNFLVRFEIMPVWNSGWPEPKHIELQIKNKTVVANAISNYLPYAPIKTYPRNFSWTAILGSNNPTYSITCGDRIFGPEKTSGNGSSVLLKYPLTLNPDAHIRLVLAGDCEGEINALKTLNRVLNSYKVSLQNKIGHYKSIAYDLTLVETPEKLLNDAFLWSKLNLEWLTQTSPYLNTAVVAGHQDFPFYFGADTEVSILGILAAGLHETAKLSLRQLAMIGKNTGKIPHSANSSGAIFGLGAIGLSAIFAREVWNTYLWTGDEEFLKDMFPICHKGINYVLQQSFKDGILLLEYQDHPDSQKDKMIPSSIVAGLESFSDMAKRIGKYNISKECRSKADLMKQQIDSLFWIEKQGLYVGRLDKNNKPKLGCDEFWGEMHTTFEGVAYYMVGEKSKVMKALTRFENPKYSTDWGLYLTNDRTFNMPITTGSAAVSEFNYGRVKQGLQFLRMIARTVGHIMPGAVPEYIHSSGDPEKYPPNSCYLQLWSAAKITQGLLWGLLHLEPDAARNRVVMQPQLPEDWPSTEYKNITIGKSKINVRLEKGKTVVTQISGPKLNIQIKE
jgi:hypothetical protein